MNWQTTTIYTNAAIAKFDIKWRKVNWQKLKMQSPYKFLANGTGSSDDKKAILWTTWDRNRGQK